MGSTSQREDSHGAVTRTATRARVSSTITGRPTGHGELHEPNASFDARPASDNNSLESRYRFNHLPFTHAARAWGQDRGELLSQSFPEPATDFHLIINGKSSVTRSRISSRTVPIPRAPLRPESPRQPWTLWVAALERTCPTTSHLSPTGRNPRRGIRSLFQATEQAPRSEAKT